MDQDRRTIINKGTKDEVLVIQNVPRGPVQIPKADDPERWKDWRPLKLN